jgi:NPCBM/NEW2 domain
VPLLTSLLALALLAAEPPAAAQGQVAPVALKAGAEEAAALCTDRQGRTTRVPLAGLDAGALSAAVLLRVTGLEPPTWEADAPDRAWLSLANGDGLGGKVVGGEGDDLLIEVLGGARVRVAIDDLASIVFEGRIPPLWASPIVAADEGDRLYRRQGDGLDRLDGTVQELGPDGVRFHGVLGSRLLPWDEVAALFVEALDEAPRHPPEGTGTPVVADLYDGSRLRGRLARLDRASCVLALRGEDVELPLRAVAALALDDGSVAFLSDSEPSGVQEGAPFGDDLGMRWPHRRDRSVTGGALRAGGQVWPRGLGVHAPSRLTWTLDGGWKRLLGSAAVDDQVLLLGSHGSVIFRVRVDGQLRFESGLVHGGDAPLKLPELDLSGAHELVLEVDPATDLFVADRADWLTMLLVR